jgi:pilus assembly protein Flp/PilA
MRAPGNFVRILSSSEIRPGFWSNDWIQQPEGTSMKNMILDFLRDEEGLTTVEYAIAGALVSLAVVTAFTDLGDAIANRIQDIITAIG